MTAPDQTAPTEITAANADLLACLPVALRNSDTAISRIAVGYSGAAVYLIESSHWKAILKITPPTESIEDWERSLEIQGVAANAGLAPAILHHDASRRAVVSAFVADLSFRSYYHNPETRAEAVSKVGRTVARVHAIPTREGMPHANPLGLLATFWTRIQPDATTPRVAPMFAYESAMRMMNDEGPSSGRPAVLSHNDMNPTNFVYDGEHVMMLDWQTAQRNDPYYDLGTIAVFLRMDDEACLQLLSAYDGEHVTEIPPRLMYCRRLVATLSGSAFLFVALQRGFADMDPDTEIADVPTLVDVYGELSRGETQLATLSGQWRFGLALIKEGLKF